MIANNHKRILYNTAMLYIRMLLTMAVTLYTSRIMLQVLGIHDFGIFHVVAGFVTIIGFLHGAMTSATQRYFAFELGETGGVKLNETFNTSVSIHILLALAIILLAETAGLWFVTNELSIPKGRIDAAILAYHYAVISFAFNVLTVPFTALIIAHERMGVFAAVSIADVMLKLIAVASLQFLDSDKLITYAALLCITSAILICIYIIYCRIAFPKIRYRCLWDESQFRAMLSYTGWNIWGNLAAVLSGQGTNILLNMFFGPSINAARAIAVQANTALTTFIQNIQSAVNPQIIKLYAVGDLNHMHSLILHVSKLNFILLFTLAYPVLLEADSLLALWLVDVPPYSVLFFKLIVINSLIDSVTGPLMTSAQATGHIRWYQVIVGSTLLFNVPLSYFFLLWGYQPYIVVVVSIGLSIIAIGCRLIILQTLIQLKAKDFLRFVLLKSLAVVLASSILIYLIMSGLLSIGAWSLIGSIITSMLTIFIVAWFVGLDSSEKIFLLNLIKYLFLRIRIKK